MPTHNSQMLLYAAMNTGELELAEQYADASVHFPAAYGPMNMADGECQVCAVGRQSRPADRQTRSRLCKVGRQHRVCAWAGKGLSCASQAAKCTLRSEA
jgi:hypothetical protein